MTLKVSNRSQISPFIVMDVMQQAAQCEQSGKTVYHLEVGQPGTPAPKSACDAVRSAMVTDNLGYTLANGRPELRSGIVDFYHNRYDKKIDPEGVFITTGSSSGFILAFLSAFDVGDRVALASPGYPAYRNILSALGVDVVDILTDPSDGFQPTPRKLEELITSDGRLDGLILASPSNPCGSMLTPEKFADIEAFCSRQQIRLVSDEIYHGVSYGIPEATAAENPEAIVVNSFSKYFSMTGWRVGWLLLPTPLRRQAECLAQNLFICPPHVSQIAALGALDDSEELEAHLSVYKKNRNLLVSALHKSGIKQIAPADGAFYAYADFSAFTDNTLKFCQKMLLETGIAATPGNDFDPTRGHKYIRFSYCQDTSQIEGATHILTSWMNQQPRLSK